MPSTDAIVIGAGLSGLAAAWRLHQAGRQVTVLEASSQVGGMIRTHRENGFTAEAGPHTFPSTATAILDLCRQLNLQPEPVQAAHKRYLFLKDQLLAVPENPLQFLASPVLSPPGKLRLLWEPLIPRSQAADISVADFFTHRLGAEFARHLMDPLISGIYAGDIQQLSLPAVFPKLWEWEQSTGSLLQGAMQARKANSGNVRSKMQLLSFPGGLQTLTDALWKALPPETVQTGRCVQRLEKTTDGFTAHLSSGEAWRASRIILATPAFVSAALLKEPAPGASRALLEIPYNGLVVVHTGFNRVNIPHPLDGFGFLAPRRENLPLLGSIWASSLFPNRAPEGQVLFSTFIGGAHHPELVQSSDEQLQQLVLDSLGRGFKLCKQPTATFFRIFRYEKAIPQYTLGHLERVQAIETELKALPHLALCGNYLQGVALEHCVQSGLVASGLNGESCHSAL